MNENKKENIFNKSLLKKVWQYLRLEKNTFLKAFAFIIVGSGIQLLTPISIEYSITNAILKNNLNYLLLIVIVMSVLTIIKSLILKSQVSTIGISAQRIMLKIRSDVFAHIQLLPAKFFVNNKSGDLISRINGDTDIVDTFLSQYIFQFASTFFEFVLFGAYLFYVDWRLACVACSCIVVTVIVSRFISPILSQKTKNALEANSIFKSQLSDNITNFQVLEAFQIKGKFASSLKVASNKVQNTNFESRFLSNVFSVLYSLATNMSTLLILVFIANYYTINSIDSNKILITLPVLIAFFAALVRFFTPLREMGSVFSSFTDAATAFNRVIKITKEPISNTFATVSTVTNNPINYSMPAIEFSDVNFSYNQSNNILEGIKFKINTSSTTALVGATGAGKSTIAKLMSGIIEPDSGSIKVFGKNLTEYTSEEFYNLVGFILQDPFLFNGTVASNIIYGNSRYSKYQNYHDDIELGSDLIDELKENLIAYNLDNIIPNLEEFLITKVNNNSQNISQGQKQIINFIRVILREPKILILDEATANLDTITEQYLQQSLDGLGNDVTKVIIAHRLNTIKDADQILLVGNRKVEVSSKSN